MTPHRESWLENRAHLWIIIAYALIAASMALQRGVLGPHHHTYTDFRDSFYHLIRHQDLYAHYAAQGPDLFKYSPAFALLFAPFALPPYALGLLFWNLCNVFALYFALRALLPRREAGLGGLLLIPEVLAATQASQSDTLVAALIILAFAMTERDRPLGAAAAIATGTAIKLFPLAALGFALFQPRPWRTLLLTLATIAALAILPLLVLSPHELVAQYQAWVHLMRVDTLARGQSVMGLLATAIPGAWPNWPVQLLGTLLFLAPLALRRDRWREPRFRLLFLASLLVYAVIFNHRAERSSFVIAVAGIVIWYVTGRATLWRTALLVLSSVGLLAPPCIVAWIAIQLDLLRSLPSARPAPHATFAEAPLTRASSSAG
ncbi:MAG TPA: glycosyltransferase family 87 protein [Gemmatimonadaceae bacterium]|nr:glycosyltransferase family 87 protein [Gemmatimonadaceae bacterium]